MNDWKQFFFMIFIKFHLIPFTQGVNHLHTLYRNETIVILKASEFYDVIVKKRSPDNVTSDFFRSIASRKIEEKNVLSSDEDDIPF